MACFTTKIEEFDVSLPSVKAEGVAHASEGLTKAEAVDSSMSFTKEESRDVPLPKMKVEEVNMVHSSTKMADDSYEMEEPPVLEPPPPPVILSDEQSIALRPYYANFTHAMDPFGGPLDYLAITAATGIASMNIGGCTLHSWAGIGLGKELVDDLVLKFLGQDKHARLKAKAERAKAIENGERKDSPLYRGPYSSMVKWWRQVKTLIIDKISMIDGVLFDKLEYIARELQDIDLPFGGIQFFLETVE
ncbi:hypothetical protein DAEQUDRAFT_766953 [Daedalea quercina L-15889]|uniref:ATP-dependent DNA helicase n=1 Tax=Daedalea quercina L-15889 TaxID=1314783 RepID=A0A165NZS1_9APHY|nr:hypothetical protein DAEQUDRAFT_766953 [Daedalea quercina L-15889]